MAEQNSSNPYRAPSLPDPDALQTPPDGSRPVRLFHVIVILLKGPAYGLLAFQLTVLGTLLILAGIRIVTGREPPTQTHLSHAAAIGMQIAVVVMVFYWFWMLRRAANVRLRDADNLRSNGQPT
ncbi:MAG: hypothetical protein RIK87_05170 [Fuerstiella sp.]